MQALGLLAVVIVTAALIAVVMNFRFLLYPFMPELNPMHTATVFKLDGNALFISDLHLRADTPFTYSAVLHELLKDRSVSNLIVVGDLFDSPDDAQKILSRVSAHPISDILGLDALSAKAFFVDGSPPHDPSRKTVPYLMGPVSFRSADVQS